MSVVRSILCKITSIYSNLASHLCIHPVTQDSIEIVREDYSKNCRDEVKSGR